MKEKNINITLTPSQYKLLLSLLNEVAETRSNHCCNDVYKSELKMFSIDELKTVLETLGKGYAKQEYKEWKEQAFDEPWEEALKGGWGLWDTSFIIYLISTIKKQVRKQ